MIRFKKIKGEIKERLPRLIEEFKREPKIVSLYLFGSYAKDEIRPLSDVDIAVFLKKNIPHQKYWDIKLNLLSKVMSILGTDEIDFVILNEAPFELAYNILKNGRILFCQNEKALIDFQENTVLNYLDTQGLREEGYFHLLERIRTGRFGYDEGRHKKDIENIRRIFKETGINCKNA